MANPAPRPTMKASKFAGSTLQAPAGYYASVVLFQVERDDEARERRYVWWVLAGRDKAVAVDVTFNNNGGDLVRIDVPTPAELNHADLLACLTRSMSQLYPPPPGSTTALGGPLPEDTPVIKGVT